VTYAKVSCSKVTLGLVGFCRLSLACQSRNVLRFILFGLLCLVTKRIARGTAIASGSESITFRKAISNLSTSSSYSEYASLHLILDIVYS
jgi:hypothetical protein